MNNLDLIVPCNASQLDWRPFQPACYLDFESRLQYPLTSTKTWPISKQEEKKRRRRKGSHHKIRDKNHHKTRLSCLLDLKELWVEGWKLGGKGGGELTCRAKFSRMSVYFFESSVTSDSRCFPSSKILSNNSSLIWSCSSLALLVWVDCVLFISKSFTSNVILRSVSGFWTSQKEG